MLVQYASKSPATFQHAGKCGLRLFRYGRVILRVYLRKKLNSVDDTYQNEHIKFKVYTLTNYGNIQV